MVLTCDEPVMHPPSLLLSLKLIQCRKHQIVYKVYSLVINIIIDKERVIQKHMLKNEMFFGVMLDMLDLSSDVNQSTRQWNSGVASCTTSGPPSAPRCPPGSATASRRSRPFTPPSMALSGYLPCLFFAVFSSARARMCVFDVCTKNIFYIVNSSLCIMAHI